MALFDFLGGGLLGGQGVTGGLLNSNPFANKGNMLAGLGAGLLSGKDWQSGFATGAQGMLSGKLLDDNALKEKGKNDALKAYAAENNLTPAQVQFMSAYPDVGAKVLGEKMMPKEDVRVVNGAIVQRQPDGTYKPVYQSPEATRPEYGLNPVFGTDKSGNPGIVQLSKTDQPIQVPLPEGFKLANGVEKIDMGTSYGIMDKRTGQVVGQMPKDVAGEAKAKEVGKAQGEASMTLPADIARADQVVKQVDDLIQHPGLGSITGGFDQYRPSWTLGSQGNDALARYKQLQGGAFLQGFQMLKGGGAITEREGEKATAAIARMDRAQNRKEFVAALTEYRDAVATGKQKLMQRAGMGGQQSTVDADGWQDMGGGVRIRPKAQ